MWPNVLVFSPSQKCAATRGISQWQRPQLPPELPPQLLGLLALVSVLVLVEVLVATAAAAAAETRLGSRRGAVRVPAAQQNKEAARKHAASGHVTHGAAETGDASNIYTLIHKELSA